MPRARAQKGIAPKPLFWEVLLGHFEKKENSDRLERAFLGSACEQWLNGELFQAIIAAWETVWVRPEKSKRDLVLYESPEAEEQDRPSLIVETKVLYSPETLEGQRAKIRKLQSQLASAEQEHPNCVTVGLVVYFDYQYSSDGGTSWLPTFKSRPYDPAAPTRRRFLSKGEVGLLGLENAFGSTHGRRRLWSGEKPHELRFGNYVYALDVKLEMVRVR